MTQQTDGDPAAWGRRLHLTRAGQWFAGNQGDPYALILRGETDDPTAYEDEVAAHGPLCHSVLLNTWVTADGAVAEAVLADNRFGWLTRAALRPDERALPLAGTALDHERDAYRRLAELSSFGGPVLHAADEDDARVRVEKIARTLLDGSGDRFDLAAFARRLSALALANLLGISAGRQQRFEDALTACGRTFDSRVCPQTLDNALAGTAATADLAALLGDMTTDASHGDLATAALAMTVGTAEPAITLICNAVQALLGRPSQWAALCADPDLAPVAVEETLRWFPPVRLESRVAHEDVVLAGETIPADSHLVILVAGVNRSLNAAMDPSRTAFDLGGPSRPAFGLPGDLCFALSAPLIRLTAETVLRVLAEAGPGLRPAGAAVRWRRSPVLHGHARLPLTWGSAT